MQTMNLRFYFLHLVIIAISLTSVAQSETNCPNLMTILNPITNTNLTTLYVGVSNRFAVSVPGVKSENLLVKLSKGTTADTIEESNGLFIARVCSVGEVVVEIYSKENGVERKLAEKTLQTRVIPLEKFQEVASSLGLKSKNHQ